MLLQAKNVLKSKRYVVLAQKYEINVMGWSWMSMYAL
jgi:hypothetical protein